MDDYTEDMVQILFHRMMDSYSLCKNERHKLHKIEWESSNGYSILGEAELASNSVAGIATTHLGSNKLKMAGEYRELAIKNLTDYPVYKNPHMSSWLINNSKYFELFANYLHSIEALRLLLIEIIFDPCNTIKK